MVVGGHVDGVVAAAGEHVKPDGVGQGVAVQAAPGLVLLPVVHVVAKDRLLAGAKQRFLSICHTCRQKA